MSDLSADDKLWLRRYRSSPMASTRLVCLPHAGGSASFFLPVATALSPDVDVIAVQYPGRQDRRTEKALTDVETLADRVAERLLRQPTLPTTFFGHSLGATVGFEIIRRLEANHHDVMHLFASGRRAPSAHRDEAVHLRDDDGILAEVRRLDGTAASVLNEQEMMRAALPSLRADYTAAESYRCAPEVAVNCSVTVLTGDADPHTTLPEAKAWERHTRKSCKVHIFSGGHFFVTTRANEILNILRKHFTAEASLPAHD